MMPFTELQAHFVNGAPSSDGSATERISSIDPFDGTSRWEGPEATPQIVDAAVSAAQMASLKWARVDLAQRIEVVERFAALVKERSESLATLISSENGKPLWDARTEVNSLVTKATASIESHELRAKDSEREVRGLVSRTRYRPHGVMAVLGPFNFPMSMANSHLLPALLSGNAVVFKPSELTPLCGLALSQLWIEAGVPAGVLNCVSGGRSVGEALVTHPNVDGVLFIGSYEAGIAIRRALVEEPDKIVALEMGGNNPLVVWDYDDVRAAVHAAVQSSLVSAGQRCSAARRLIVRDTDADLLSALTEAFRQVRVGHYKVDPEPFYGPVIRQKAADRLVRRFHELEHSGAVPIVRPALRGPLNTLVLPGLIDMTDGEDRDEEIFGPMLKLYRVPDLKAAIELSNATRFGLSAGIICRDRAVFEEYFDRVKAGIVNWNQQLTGATAFAPFGGVKHSGNHRPAGSLSVDYCNYAVASFEVPSPRVPDQLAPGLKL